VIEWQIIFELGNQAAKIAEICHRYESFKGKRQQFSKIEMILSALVTQLTRKAERFVQQATYKENAHCMDLVEAGDAEVIILCV